MNDLPYSQACENNKEPILRQLTRVFSKPGLILEIGTGTAQHAVHFADALPHIQWQPTEHPDALPLAQLRLQSAALPNLMPIQPLDVASLTWPIPRFDGVFTANTAHIMAWSEVERMFEGVAGGLMPYGAFCLYGPFNVQGRYTSEGNRRFDQHLRSTTSHMGIRDMDDLVRLAAKVGLTLIDDVEMPANNRLLVFAVADSASVRL
jgi:hypothetical protein